MRVATSATLEPTLYHAFLSRTDQKHVSGNWLAERFACLATGGELNVLEVGAGTGELVRHLLAGLNERGVVCPRVTLVEPNPAFAEGLENVRGWAQGNSLGAVEVRRARAEEWLDVPAATRYRLVLFIHSFHYMDPEARTRILRSCWDRVEPGGVMCVAACWSQGFVARFRHRVGAVVRSALLDGFMSDDDVRPYLLSLDGEIHGEVVSSHLRVPVGSESHGKSEGRRILSFLCKIDPEVLDGPVGKRLLKGALAEGDMDSAPPLEDMFSWVYRT